VSSVKSSCSEWKNGSPRHAVAEEEDVEELRAVGEFDCAVVVDVGRVHAGRRLVSEEEEPEDGDRVREGHFPVLIDVAPDEGARIIQRASTSFAPTAVVAQGTTRVVEFVELVLEAFDLAPIGILVLSGWAAHWLFVGGPEAQFLLFKSWFQTLSFFGALTVATLAAMKYFGKGFLSESAERLTLSVATLCPVVGYLIEIVTSLGTFLSIGGSIALGYISLTTYWRKHIPQFATDPLGEASKSIKRAENSPSSQPDAACENAEKEKLETQLV